jgi:hypothetical protein
MTATLAIVATLALAGGQQPGFDVNEIPLEPPSSPLLGMSLNLAVGEDIQDLLDHSEAVRQMGFQHAYHSAHWAQLEPEPRAYSFEDSDGSLYLSTVHGQYKSFTIQTLDTTNRVLPVDLVDKDFDDPEVLDRWRAFLREFVPRLGEQTLYLSLGNEVDGYLRSNPDQVEPFLEFLRVGRQTVKNIRPELSVGVTSMYSGLVAAPDLTDKLHEGMDFVSLTYYVTMTGKAEENLGEAFEEMVAFAGQRPLALQELGCPSAEEAGSSEARQLEFVEAAFAAIERHQDDLAYVNFFLLIDFSDALVETLTEYYGSTDPGFVGFLSSLGFHDADGNPKLAWQEIQRQMKAFGS